MRSNTPKLLQRNLFTLIVLFGLVVLVTTVFSSLSLRSNLTNEFVNRGTDIAGSIASASTELLLDRDVSTIQSTIDSFLDPETGVAYIFVVNDKNEFVSHTFVPEVPPELFELAQENTGQISIRNLEIANRGDFINISAPVLAGTAGNVHVGMDLGIIAGRIQSVVLNQIFLVTLVFLVSVAIAYIQTSRISRPLLQLTEYVQMVTSRGASTKEIAQKEAELQPVLQRNDEVGQLAQNFEQMITEVRSYEQELEQRVAARTQDLNLAAEIGRQVTQAQNIDDVLVEATTLMKERFDLYQVQIYLSDSDQENLILRASDGYAGSRLLEAGHTLPINLTSLNGSAAYNKQAVIVEDTQESDSFRPNPLLPDTRSETAVPLLIGENVVGVLDLQSDQPNTFTEENLPAFTTLAGQLAIAIDNSRLFTEQKRTANLLAEEETRTRAILESIGTPIVIARVTDGLLVYLNEPTAQILDVPREELIGQATPEFFHNPDDRQTYVDSLRQHGQITNYEVLLKKGDDSPFWALLSGRIVQFQGEMVTITSFVDITERQKAIATMQANEALLRTIIDSTPDWIFIKDTDHRYQLVNQAYADAMHLSPGEFIGKNDIEIGFPEEIVKGNPQKGIRGFWADDREIMDQGEIKIIDEEPAIVDGESRVLNTIKVPLKDSGDNVTGIVGFVHDITIIKQAEATMSKQATELQIVAELSTAVSTTLNTEQLLLDIVNRTKESFNLYHAHIYLLDESDNTLKLAAGAGDVGAKMVAEGYTIPLDNEKSIVAQTARNKRGIIVNDVTADPAFLPNTLLPGTKSEMAVPMMVGNKVIGVLDVQADQMENFTETDINIQTTLATQIAVALENARAFEQVSQQETILRQRDLQLAQANDLAGMATWEFDLKNQIFTLNDQLYYTILGTTLAEVGSYQMPANDFLETYVYPEDVQNVIVEITNALTQTNPDFLGYFNYRLVDSNKRLRHVQNEYRLSFDNQGQPEKAFGYLLDITERREAEETIQRNEVLMRTIIDSTPDWIFVKDNQHRYQMVNRAYAETSHMEPEALIGKTILDVGLPPEIAQSILAEDEAFMAGEETLIVSEENVVVDGKTRYQTITKVLLKDALGQAQGMVGFTHDVTAQVTAAADQKQLRQELEGQLERVNALQSAMTRENWQAFMTATAGKRAIQGFEFNQDGIMKTLTAQDLINGKNGGALADNKMAAEFINPVKIQGTTIGKIGVRNPSGEPLSDAQRELLASLTGQVAEALDRARLFEETELGRQEIEHQAAELSTVNEISELVSTQLNIDDLVNAVGDRLIETFSANSVYIALVDEKSRMINFPYFTNTADGPLGIAPRSLDDKGGFTAKIYQTRQPVIHNPADQNIASAVLADGGEVINSSHDSNTYIGVPMIIGEKVIGVIGLNGQQDRRMYGEEDVPLLTTLASTIAVSLQNAQQFEDTQRRANREALVNEISQKIQNASTIESAMQTAVTELGKALNLKQAVVKLNKSDAND